MARQACDHADRIDRSSPQPGPDPAAAPSLRQLFARQLSPGCLVAHEEHGIGLFEGIETVEAADTPHACFRLLYDKDDKLFVPVEHADLVTYYGAAGAHPHLDRLGSHVWVERRQAFQESLQEIAEELVRTRQSRDAARPDPIARPDEYDVFAGGFGHEPTPDQARALREIEADLASGRLMDRLICGDVGFGKTEMALRAAFLTAMAGQQVAVIAPTTLLCRQHVEEFTARFADWPVEVVELSRGVPAKTATANREAIRKGRARIAIGTQALLGRNVRFANLGLLIIDEEQRFGVQQKEKLKRLGEKVHVLAMTATPIPRTLQMTITGLSDVSLITTPPPDRKPVRTRALAFEAGTIRDALTEEKARGGQSFYVCPRVKDLELVRDRLAEMAPDLKVVLAHGRMKAEEIEAAMSAFVAGRGDILLSTNIVESGLNIPNASTMIVHRADMFGMAQLHQLRGRVGRSPTQAYVYLTYEEEDALSDEARARLDTLTRLQTLGSGFELASQDLDLRGAGTVFGDRQAGHMHDVGAELAERLLAEKVEALTQGREPEPLWRPQIQTGLPVFIPEDYIPDADERVTLYRRLAQGATPDSRVHLEAELEALHGPLPQPVLNLISVSAIKHWCRRRQVEEFDIGPKGIRIRFREGHWLDASHAVPDLARAEVDYVPGEKLVFHVENDGPAEQLKAAEGLMDTINRAVAA